MIRIWAKVLKDDKIIKDLIYTSPNKYNVDDFMSYVVDICYQFDLPTPMLLACNVRNWELFNNTRFRSSDFVEYVDLDMLVLENAAEK